MKPIYRFALIITVVLLVGLLGYFIWQWIQPHAPKTPVGGVFPSAPSSTQAQATTTTPLPAYELKKLSDDGVSVFDSIIDQSGNPLYIKTDGTVYEPKPGPDAAVATQTFSALNFTLPSPDNRYALLAYGDPKLPQWVIFDTADRVWRPFNVPMYTAAWKDSATLVAILPGANSTRILATVPVTSNFSASSPVYTALVNHFPLLDVTLSWSDALNALIVQEKGSGDYTPRTWQFDTKTDALTLLNTGKPGALISWLPGGYALQYTPPATFSVLQHTLALAFQPLFTTLPGKCDISGTTLFCFAPLTFPTSPFTNAFAEDYYQGSARTVDEFYAIDLATGTQNHLFVSGSENIPQIDAEEVRAASTSTLYFVNRYDGGLYELQIH